MRHRLVAGAILPLALFARSTVAQTDTSLIAAGAKLERVFCCGVFLEGPAAAPDGSIYFTDITATYNYVGRPLEQLGGVIRRYDPKTGTTTVYQSPSAMATGLEFAPNGQMYITHAAHLGTRMVTRIDLTTGLGYIAAHRYNGRPYNSPNDLAADHQGRIYFSDPRYIGDEPIDQPVLGVYRIDTDGSQHLITADLGKPNGVAVSPDQKTLYVASIGKSETDRMPQPVPTRSALEAIVAYDLDADGNVKFRKLVVDYLAAPSRPEKNGPDGIDTDAFGNIWGTQLAWKAVVAYSPDGRELGRIPVEEGATNLEFGRGAESDVLYITGKTALYKVKVKSRGWHAGQR